MRPKYITFVFWQLPEVLSPELSQYVRHGGYNFTSVRLFVCLSAGQPKMLTRFGEQQLIRFGADQHPLILKEL